ncbi:SUKH-4 family immunity protein [Streptomyces pinistramenti]|uniref:SUKH-4 family immunity protein n=1 Tax=Streptomyces pinistramenti TaxID=2884812 RepID=UPI001D076A1C|nr:SUKH-4 family immunity protein [Streptomyces pinistramenti]MCB5907590.1 SUKH-4 family immunity protein [Streptomyces pinistramenti]
MVTFAQAQERAELWVNGEVPGPQQREVRVREFDLGFVAWAEDREGGPHGEGGRSRLVIARDSGETTLWPGLPVGEVIRRYEEEYGAVADGGRGVAEAPQRIDLEATSFLLTPPEWLQEVADAAGGAERGGAAQGGPAPSAVPGTGGSADAWAEVNVTSGAGGEPGAGEEDGDRSVGLPETVFAPPLAGIDEIDEAGEGDGAELRARPEAQTELLRGGSQLPHTQIAAAADGPGAGGPQGLGGSGGASGAGGPGAVPPMPSAPPVPPGVPGLSDLPPPSGAPVTDVPPPDGAVPGGAVPPVAGAPGGSGPGGPPPPPPVPSAGAGGGVHAAATMLADGAALGGPGAGAAVPPPPTAPGTPGARAAVAGDAAAGQEPAPGAPAGGYVPTQLVSQLDAGGLDLSAVDGSGDAGASGASGASGGEGAGSGGGVHAAATMLAGGVVLPDGAAGAAGPGGAAGGPGVPPPPAPPGAPKPPGAPGRPGAQAGGRGASGQGGPPLPPAPAPAPSAGAGGGVHAAATMLAGGAVAPGPAGPGPVGPGPGGQGGPQGAGPAGSPPGPPVVPPAQQGGGPGAYGYPQPAGVPTVGPGYMAVLSYRAPDGSEQKIVRRSAPGTPHPEWQLLHELRGMNIPPQQVLELHTELECCDLPGGYCARMIRDTWPQVRISHTAAYGRDHASRQQGVRHLVEHQGELHQVADGPARPAPVRVPLPHPSQVQPVPPAPPQAVGQELEQSFGPQGIFRFDQRAVSRQGVPDVVAQMLVWAGLPVDFGPFFWAQAQPGRPVPTLAELAAERGVQPAADAGSYLVMGNDFGRQLCVQYGTANIVAVPVEAGPGGQPAAPQFVNSGLPEFMRCLAMLGRMWRLRYGLTPEQAGHWTVDFQAQLVALDPPALSSPETWWSVLLEQMWDGLL